MKDDERNLFIAIAGLLLCCLISFGGWLWWNAESPFEGSIIRLHWDYVWNIEELRAVENHCGSSTCEPEHSYNHRTRHWITTTLIRSGKTTVPITTHHYQFYYTLNQWVIVASEHATGEGNIQRPYYPELTLIRAYGSSECPETDIYTPTSPALGCQRAGGQYPHHYYQIQTDNLETDFIDTCEMGFGLWTEQSAGNRLVGEYFSNRNQIDCASVEVVR